MCIRDRSELLGYNFVDPHDGFHQRGEVSAQEDENTYRVTYTDGGEEIKTYQEIINLINRTDESGHQLWSFSDIIGHR